MNYLIIINIILSILICLIKADTECPVDKVCMDTEEDTEESCIQLFHQTSDHSYVEFCNKEKTKICCVPPYMPKTVSEKSEFFFYVYHTYYNYNLFDYFFSRMHGVARNSKFLCKYSINCPW